jgi:hypothetical protein
MHRFLVRRTGIAAGAAELDAALTRLRSFEETPPPQAPCARWLRSYALREADGRLGLLCLFEADSAAALVRHAELTRSAADEIVPLHATAALRAFAPNRVYLVRRRCLGAADADPAFALARIDDAPEMGARISRLHSYAVGDEHALGSWCLLQAADADAVREHAARTGLPTDEITPVIGRIVFRDETRPPSARA